METIEKPWGKEQIICNNELYCGKFLHLKKGYRSSLHMHKKKDETFYILKGKLLFELNDEENKMYEGDVVHIKPGDVHRFSGIRDSIIIEFSTHHEDNDSYRLNDSKKMKIIYADIDGKICTNEQGKYEESKPIQWSINTINRKYDEGMLVILWTSRGTTTGIDWTQLTENQLKEWGVKY
ncbi:MAG: cupin domain-containing protein, partial [bacterium]